MPSPYPYRWFRVYNEIVDDEKIRLLRFEDRWHYIAILCLKSVGYLDKTTKPDLFLRGLAIKLDVDLTELEDLKIRLIDVGLINDCWQPTGWDERQFKSDASKERMREYRERQTKSKRVCDVASHVRHGDVTVTAQEAEAETETDNIKSAPPATRGPPRGEPVKAECESVNKSTDQPQAKRLRTRIDPDIQLTEKMHDAAVNYWRKKKRLDLNPVDEFEHFVAHHKANGKAMAEWSAAWQTWYVRAINMTRARNGPHQRNTEPRSPVERLIGERKERERLELGNVYEHESDDIGPTPH